MVLWSSSTCQECDGAMMPEKCGMGYPSARLACIRPKGHHSPVSICFSIRDNVGVYMYQDGKAWIKDESDWPNDIILDEDDQSKNVTVR